MPPEGKRLRLASGGVQNYVHIRMAVGELKKAAPAEAPSGLAVSESGSAPSGPVDSTLPHWAAQPFLVTPALSGPAASGNVAFARAAQPPREPPLAPATG
eukprot:3263426-Pyramimonas_sp.AAC.1